jgi:hypothetical protein
VLIEAAVQFPTVVFTIGLGIVLLYWVFVLIGALDIHLFGDGVDVAGAAKGVALKADVHHDADVGHGGGVWSGLGLARVPITISVSAIFLVGWVISLAAMYHLPDMLGGGAWIAPTVLLGTLIVTLPLAGLLVRPLGGVFTLNEGKSNHDYIGHTCTITTSSVTEKFGQATIEDGGTVHIVAVRCDRAAGLGRGSKALIIEFDRERDAFVVEPGADMLPKEG